VKELRSLLPVALIYLLLLLPEFWPFLFQGKALYQGDIFLYFEPVLRYIGESLKHGRLPLWNPLVCNGVPQIAIISPGLFYAPNFIFYVLPFGTALGAVMMFHQWLAGCGTFLLARREGFGTIAATMCGAMLMLNGYMFGSSQCYTLPATFAWTPLGLWLVSCYIGRSSPIPLVGLSFVYALQIFAGRPELFLSAGFLYVMYALVCKVEAKDGQEPMRELPGASIGQVIMIVLGLACGAALAAPALLPVFELYSLSPRMTGLRMGEVALWSAGWFDWLQTLLCRPFGDLVVSNYHLSPHYPGLFPYISSLYLGPAVITLSLLGWLNGAWKQRLFWALIGLFFFALALGGFGPLLPALHHLAPGLVVLRYPIKLAVFALFAACMAAGAGWDLASRQGVKMGLLNTLGALWIFVLTMAVIVWFNLFDIRNSIAAMSLGPRFAAHGAALTQILGATAVQAAAVAALGLLSLILIPGLRKTVRVYEMKRLVCAAALSALVLTPQAISGCAALWHYTNQSFYSLESPFAEFIKAQADVPYRILVFPPDSIVAPEWLWRRDDPLQHSIVQSQYERDILYGDVNMSYGLPAAYGFVPTDTKAFMLLYVGVCSRSHQFTDPERVGAVSDLPLARFCQVCGVRNLITLTVKPNPQLHVIETMPLLDEEHFDVALEDEKLNVRIYQVRNALPRFYMTYSWRPVQSQVEAIKEIYWADKSGFDPTRQTLLQTRTNAVDDELGTVPGDATLVRDNGETVVILARAKKPGYLVLADTDYPGWKVTVDGRPAEIVQSNGLHKAVALSAGNHEVVFQYRPYSLFWAFVLTGIALLGLLLILLRGKPKRSFD
jgi:hypothetical protein